MGIDWHLIFDILKAATPVIVGLATYYFKGIKDDLTQIKRVVTAGEQRLAVSDEKFVSVNETIKELRERIKILERNQLERLSNKD